MAKRNIFLIAIVALLLIVAGPMMVSAQFTPEVFTVDQDVVDGTLNITRATVNGDGWVAVHADDAGAPGDVIGYAPLMDGVNANVKVEVDPTVATGTLYAALYTDAGESDVFEVPGADEAVMVDGEAVIQPFEVTGEANTIVGTARNAGGFDTLLAAVDAAGLTKTLQGAGPFTVFAPTDDAFAALPEGTLDSLLEDPETLGQILTYHVLPGAVMAADISDGLETATVQGDNVTFGVGDNVTINDAVISATDIAASNGVIHVIDSVILPPAVAEAMAPAAAEAASEEEEAPEVPAALAAMRQESDGTSVTIEMVEAAQDGWVSVRADEAYQPGAVLGYAPVSAGVNENVVVTLDEPLAESQMVHASLHVDDGEMGVFEFPDADPVAMYQNSPINVPFNVVVGAAAEAASEEEEAPEVPAALAAMRQESDGASVTIEMIEAAQDGWVSVRTDEAYQPGAVLGYAPVSAGVNENVVVMLDEPLAENQMVHASLHVDDGETGVFEFPDADPIAMYQNSPLNVPFNVIVGAAMAAAEATEEATEEAAMTPEATEEATEEAAMTPEPTEEATEEAAMTPEPTEEATEEAAMTPEPTEEATEEAAMTPEPTEEATEEAVVEAAECMDIIDTAVSAEGFGTLVTAVQAAGLVDTLKSEGPFTVFAPTDDAFAALPDGLLDGLLADPEGALKEVLLYHVITDKLMADDIAMMGSSVTAQGQSVTFTVDGDSIMVNDANVAAADIEACNGVIHVIDKIIVPALDEAEMTPEATEEATEEAMMTPEPTEEATEEAMMTPEATEEATEEAMMTPEPTEEAMAEAGTIPGTLPGTGASMPSAATTFPTLLLVSLTLAGTAYVMRRRED